MKKFILLSIVLVGTFFSSCTHRLTDFTIISTKNVDLSRASELKRTGERTNGRDRIHIVLIFPLGSPNLKEAIDRAIESTKGAVALVDGVVYHKSFYIPFIYGNQTYIVEGSPLVDPTLFANLEVEHGERYAVVTVDGKGLITETKEISLNEFQQYKSRVIKRLK